MCNTQMVDTSGEDYNVLVTCATRYAIGRASYMPSLVVAAIRPYLKYLETKTLLVLARDIEGAPSLGWRDIDEPLWRELLTDVKKELERRARNA